MFSHADWADTRSAAAVRDGKSLVQIQVAYICADDAGAGQPHLRVHVRAIHVNLAAIGVDDGGDVPDRFLVNAVRTGISHHQAGELVAVQTGFFAQIGHVYVALLIAFHPHDGKTVHRSAGGVGAVCRGGNQRHVALAFAARTVVCLYHQQARIFAGCAAVGLKTHLREAGNLGQCCIQTRDEFLITCRL